MKMGGNAGTFAVLQAKLRRPGSRYFGIHQFRATAEDVNYFSSYRKLFPLKASLQDYHGAPFPKKADQIFSNKVPKQPVSAYREILWAIARCEQFKDAIRDFCELRLSFESAVLLDDYPRAVQILDEIESRFGKSIWLYQNRMASAHIGPTEILPSEIATGILEEVKGNQVLHPLLHYVRRRIESAGLRDKLRTEIEELIESVIYSSYFRAKILDVTDSGEAAVSSLLFMDAHASVIDHYSSLVLVLQAAASDRMLTSEMVAWILPTLSRLYEGTNDHRLIGVMSALGRSLTYSSTASLERMHAIESYTAGDFEECIERSAEVLRKNPIDSAIRLLQVKAAVAMERQLDSDSGLRGELQEHYLIFFRPMIDSLPASTH